MSSWLEIKRALCLMTAVCCWLLTPGAVSSQQTSCAAAASLATLITRVADAGTRVPVQGAQVTVSWREGGKPRQTRVRTDSAATAVVCAPPGNPISVNVAHLGASASTVVVLSLAEPTRKTLFLTLPFAQIRGSVVDHETAQPVPNAVIRLAHTALTARTLEDGTFAFNTVPIGDYEMVVEQLGYKSNSVLLKLRDDDLEAQVRLSPEAIPLAPIVVSAYSAYLERSGFYDRRRRGIGTFMDRKQIEAMHLFNSADLLRNVPGIRLLVQMPRRAAPRTATANRSSCRFTFVVDGTRVMPDFEMENIPPYGIEGVEVYSGVAEVPAVFRAIVSGDAGAATCGVIVIWTRDSR